MTHQGVGARVPRKEDDRLLRGRGDYVSDIILPNQSEVAFLRSPVAHAAKTASAGSTEGNARADEPLSARGTGVPPAEADPRDLEDALVTWHPSSELLLLRGRDRADGAISFTRADPGVQPSHRKDLVVASEPDVGAPGIRHLRRLVSG